MKKSLFALAMGTFGLGISEYAMMGILDQVASGLGVSIPQAGHLISAYALGVCVGAPLTVVFARRLPLRQILLGLAVVYSAGGLCSALAPNYKLLFVSRFLSGLPHGAYFGVGAIIAGRLAERGRETAAVAAMISGMTVSNLIGVPLGPLVSSHLSWRVVYGFTALWGVLLWTALRLWVPEQPPLPDRGFLAQFHFLKKPAPWLLLAGISLGNGAIFCWYSYVNPVLTRVSGFTEGQMTGLMTWAGLGMVAGNLVGGRLSDRYSPSLVVLTLQVLTAFLLFGLFLGSENPLLALGFTFTGAAFLFALSAPQQLLVIQNSKGGEMLGSACSQIGFNLGNALGAWVGALPVRVFHQGYEAAALAGLPLALLGFVVLLVFRKRCEGR